MTPLSAFYRSDYPLVIAVRELRRRGWRVISKQGRLYVQRIWH